MVRNRILACIPLIVVALLVGAWIANFFGQVGLGVRTGKFDYHFAFRSGSLSLSRHDNDKVLGLFWRANPTFLPPDLAAEVGDISSLSARLRFGSNGGHWFIEVPIVLLATAFVPLVFGSFLGFRFRLWQCFAFTAIVALELAYFLRR